MIGKVYISVLPYYDVATKTTKFKGRPCLIIGQADIGDYIILPISTIPDKTKVNPYYDIFLDKAIFTFLNKDSYLRTHKQTVINIAHLKQEISDFKKLYEEAYLEVLAKVNIFQEDMIEKAL